ncbi:MAG: hypothetical protein BWX71_00502 [Deltaproteobacteria bacterium ADurb.Bin072]|nr:MAG: hypothetical protein BWX71_00502 [Deltaproteobacteria bacterium ADurb.Bin072]
MILGSAPHGSIDNNPNDLWIACEPTHKLFCPFMNDSGIKGELAAQDSNKPGYAQIGHLCYFFLQFAKKPQHQVGIIVG